MERTCRVLWFKEKLICSVFAHIKFYIFYNPTYLPWSLEKTSSKIGVEIPLNIYMEEVL